MDISKIKLPNNDILNFKDEYARATLLGKENIANKVTKILKDSTDDQYPSAKAVVDYTKGAITVESLDSVLIFNNLYSD